MKSLNQTIGKKLKQIRTIRGMSLEEAADLTGVSKPMLGQIERGQSVPTVTTRIGRCGFGLPAVDAA